ncbi:hypothetical protein [Billgrantia ethanolica]|uniref:Uncharacterized protein n=1 Tax=Billgrantia ethanolica TaxID=2733486 RepID=A0ABS9A914_9GAMM|nr:hypothetical protein [Halomonas ethanolica]MCE8005309.1 hypothetical protein [Halomonas ethanolica]
MLPDTAFDDLNVPKLSPVPADADSHQLRLFASRLLRISALTSLRLGRPLEAERVVSQVGCLEALDNLFLELANEELPPEAWEQIATIQAGFGEHALPRVYQGRDPRLCALVVFLQSSHCQDAELMRLLNGFTKASRCDDHLYRTTLASLGGDGALTDLAIHVLEHLESNRPVEVTHSEESEP